MKNFSKQVDEILEGKEKSNQTHKESDRFDINAFFDNEKSKSESLAEKDPQNEHRVEQYSVENEVNREQRHAFLMRVRITRSLFAIIVLMITLFLLGVILTISGAFYLQNNDIDRKVSNSVEDLLPDSSKIISDELKTNSTLRDKEVINLFEEINESTQKYGKQFSYNDIKSTTIDTNEDSFESQFLEELVPDFETNDLINRLKDRMVVKTRPDEYRLEDLPQTLLNVGRFFTNLFNISIPRERLNY